MNLPRLTTLAWLLALSSADTPVLHAATRPATNAVTISAGLVRGFPGSTVAVPVSFRHTGEVSAIQFDLDATAARMVSGSMAPGAVSNQTVLRSRQIAPGRHRVLVYTRNQTPVQTNVDAGSIAYSVAAGDLGGGGPVRIANPLASNPAGSVLGPIRRIHGGVLVGPVFRDPEGAVDLFLTVPSNGTYVVQATADFVVWTNLATNTVSTEYLIYKDLEGGEAPWRFYRAIPEDEVVDALNSAALLPDGSLAFAFPAAPGRTYVIQSTTNLSEWQAWATQFSTNRVLRFTNQVDRAPGQRFFRLVEQP